MRNDYAHLEHRCLYHFRDELICRRDYLTHYTPKYPIFSGSLTSLEIIFSMFEVAQSDLWKLNLRFVMAYRAPLPNPTAWYDMHNDLCVAWLIEKGYVDISTDQGRERVHAGNWVFQSPGLILDQVFAPETHIISMRFRLLWPNGRSLFHDAHYAVVDNKKLPGFKATVLALLKKFPKAIDSRVNIDRMEFKSDLADAIELEVYRLKFLHAWYQIVIGLGFIPRAQLTGDERVNKASEMLGSLLKLSNVPYKKIERELSISRAQLDRLFVRHLQRSPKAELDRLRLQYAREQLWDTNAPIKQIAFHLGFKDASQFARWFKRLDGRNPNESRLEKVPAV